MLKQILDEKIKEQATEVVVETKSKPFIEADHDPEIEQILPFVAKHEGEYDQYRVLLAQLKKRNSKAFKKIVNFD